VIGISQAIRIEDVGGKPHGGERDAQAAASSGRRPGQRPAAHRRRPPYRRRPLRRACCGPATRNVGGERGQLGSGPRGQRLARPHAEFVPCQLAPHERGLQRLDHPLAVGVARPELVAARRRVLRSRHHQPFRASTMQLERNAAVVVPDGQADRAARPDRGCVKVRQGGNQVRSVSGVGLNP
jgi:hypothetical protein